MKTFTGNTRKEELDKLNDGYQKLLYMSIVLVGFAVAALITALVKMMPLSVAFLVVLMVARVTLHRKARNDYQQTITEAALTCAVGSKLDQYELSKKGGIGISSGDVLSAELFPVKDSDPDAIGFYQGIAGTLRGTDISLNDTTLPYYMNDPKNAGRKKPGVCCGIWMRFALPKDSGLDIRILSDGYLPDDLRKEYFGSLPGLKRREAQKAGFTGSLYLYEYDADASDEEIMPSDIGDNAINNPVADEGTESVPAAASAASVTASRTYPASFAAAVTALNKKSEGKFGISLRGNTLSLFMPDRVLSPSFKTNVKPDDRFLQLDPIPEFKDALDLVKSIQVL